MAVFIGDPDTHRLATPPCFFGVLVMFVSAVLGGGCVWLYLLVTLALADEDPSLLFFRLLVIFLSAVTSAEN